MTFDKSKVYTALNAEELEVGSEVIVAYDLDSLKYRVEANSWPTYVKNLDEVLGPDHIRRFKLTDGRAYHLAYVVRTVDEAESEEEEKWIVYIARYRIESVLCCCAESCWGIAKKFDGAKTKLFVGSEGEAKEWCNSRQKFTETIKGWEDGKTIQVYNTFENKWVSLVETPRWYDDCEYRIKLDDLIWTDLKVGDILVTNANDGWELKKMVVGIHSSPKTQLHICIGDAGWIHDDELKEWRKAEC